ncbi:MAG: hypothetical protein D6726_03695 [Nitrospirae bacterium]|nr:MAG: hypothetical protein D6726_03695 [Nitrospirota bacterium]
MKVIGTIRINVGAVSLRAEVFDTAAGRALLGLLPIKTNFNVWGDEFYFEVPFELLPDETATTSVNVGDVGYWPPGRAVAIFFGPTPLSVDERPVPAGEVNMVGRIIDDPKELIEAKSEEWMEILKV